MQFFKGDEKELKFYNSGKPEFDSIYFQKNEFSENAFDCFMLGEAIHETECSPIGRAVNIVIFREAFSAIFNSFEFVGSFESYLTVFKTIFGDDVQVTFTIPDTGKLEINIVATGIQLFDFNSRFIQNNSYQYETIIDDEGDVIGFQIIKGFQSQYELEQMLFEMVPAGIYTTISLTLGE